MAKVAVEGGPTGDLLDWTVMELVCCGYKGSCQTRRCSCVSNGLPCTEACTCQDNCVNSVTEEQIENDYDDSDDDIDDDESDK